MKLLLLLTAGGCASACARPILDYHPGEGARVGQGFDLSMRNPDFPRTHIAVININLSYPEKSLTLIWTGPLAPQGPTGPFRSSGGKGTPDSDCDDPATSNRIDSLCTPKGVFPVVAFSDHLVAERHCEYTTWIIHAPRFIGIHSHHDVSPSSGCIRTEHAVAKLIHNNSVVGETLVDIRGQWQRETARIGGD